MSKVLNIIDTAYRAHLEEQDDTSMWLIHAINNAGVENQSILLTGNAVNYAVKTQKPKALNFGSGKIPYPNKLHEDLQAMSKKGIKLFFLAGDVKDRGISQGDLIGEVEGIDRSSLADFVDDFDHIWRW